MPYHNNEPKRDPNFDNYPYEAWLEGAKQARIGASALWQWRQLRMNTVYDKLIQVPELQPSIRLFETVTTLRLPRASKAPQIRHIP